MIEATIKETVKEHYTRAAAQAACCEGDDCCVVSGEAVPVALADIPSFGCGSPVEAADLQSGEVVLDLGSGPGLDAFRAAQRVGSEGRVIGVDMTPAMIARSAADAARLGFSQTEFRLGEIEHLPVENGSVDVVISNCVLNLVPDKDRSFSEAYRVLRPGGRLVVSDMVRAGPRPSEPPDPQRWAACIDGADPEAVYVGRIHRAGFEQVTLLAHGAGDVYSVTVRARKPERPQP